MLLNQNLNNLIFNKNKNISKKSHLNQIISNFKINNITQLPEFLNQSKFFFEFSNPILQTINKWNLLKDRKIKLLSRQYVDRLVLWKKYSMSLDDYFYEEHNILNKWPPEFSLSIIKTQDKVRWDGFAKEQPQYIDENELNSYLFYNENDLVIDPLLEYNKFKNRITWTDNEKQIFIEKYSNSPKDFKKISNAIQSKSIKDVIEYYFLNRIKLNLKQIDNAPKNKNKKNIRNEGIFKK